MDQLVGSMDWSQTPLGPIQSWSAALRAAVRACLGSSSPMAISWGAERALIYNDAYRSLLGTKHPRSVGHDFATCWAAAWPVIGESFSRALTGEPVCLSDQRMFLDRGGYLEETFLTFSFCPIRDEAGAVGGLFHSVVETTATELNVRWTRCLRDVAVRMGHARTVDDVFVLAAQSLAEYQLDLPFTLIYALDANGTRARLAATSGFGPGTTAGPEEVDLEGAASPSWPLGQIVRSGAAVEVDLAGAPFDANALPVGPYPESPRAAVLLPIVTPGVERPVALLIAGVSARLALDPAYRAFFDQVAASIAAAASNVRALAVEHQRMDELATFIGTLGHRLRNPLSAISTAACLLDLQIGKSAKLAKPVGHILTSTDRMGRMISQLLDFTSLRYSRGLRVQRESGDLAEVWRWTIEEVKAACGREVELHVVGNTQGSWDLQHMSTLGSTLALNACLHGAAGVPARIQLDGSRLDVVRLEVRNQGIIPPELLRVIFELPFRAGDGPGRPAGSSGLGLGLFIARAIVLAHAGTIAVTSNEGPGTVFQVELPRHSEHRP